MNLQSLSDQLGLSIITETWQLEIALVGVAALLANLLTHFLLNRLQQLTRLTASPWDDALVQAAKRPLPLLIWLIGIAMAAGIVGEVSDARIFKLVTPFREIVVVICLAWFLIRLIRNVTKNILALHEHSGEPVDRTTVDALSKLGRFTVLILAGLITIQSLGFSISGVLAAGGIGGLALGFAAKDLLANFFGGLTIYLDRPFSVGDWIRSPDKSIEGTVEYISWRHTRVRGFNKNPIYVPNALFTTIVVENPSRMTNRRIKETIGIRYEDISVMGKIVAEVKTMLQHHPDIDTNQTLIVNFNTFGPSSLDFFIYTFTRTREWVEYHGVKQDVLLKVAEIIDRNGAQIAFPTQTLHIESTGENGTVAKSP